MSIHSPSWSDAIQATLGSCLPCLRQNSGDSGDEESNPIRRPPRHLESLLADVPDTDTEAETVSLHSNVGDSRRRQKKKRGRKGEKFITFFGFNLFGKRTGAIRLPDSDEEDEVTGDYGQRRRRQRGQRQSSSGAAGTRSSSASLTFDSDAASLDPQFIEQLTPEQLEERARLAEAEAAEARARARAAEEERRREKEERRRKRRERKELKKLAEALARNENSTGEFEGFQGSGDVPPGFIPGQDVYEYNEHNQLYQPPSEILVLSPNPELQPRTPLDPGEEAGAEGEDVIDLGGGLYAGHKRDYRNKGGSGRDSDSRSRTSASRSETSTSQLASPHAWQGQFSQHSPVPLYTPELQQQFSQGYPQPYPQHLQNPQQPYAPHAPLSLPALQILEASTSSKKKKSLSSSESKSSKSSQASSVSHSSRTSQSIQSPSLASSSSRALPVLPLVRDELGSGLVLQSPQADANGLGNVKDKDNHIPSPLTREHDEIGEERDELDELDEFGVDPDRVGGDAVLIEAPSNMGTLGSLQVERGFPSPGLSSSGKDRGFPSTGFGGPRNFGAGKMGAFLANVRNASRGDGEERERSHSPDLDI